MVRVLLMSGACRQPRPAAFCWRREPAIGKLPPPTSPGHADRSQRETCWCRADGSSGSSAWGGSRDAPGLGCEDLLAQLTTICGKGEISPISRQGGHNVHVKLTCAWRNRESKFLLYGCEGLQLCQAGMQACCAGLASPRSCEARRQRLQRNPSLLVPPAALLMLEQGS